MPTVHVPAGSADRLQEIANSLWKAKKVVLITGAGISTNSGIPDFRSENGLYSVIQGQFDTAARLNGSKPQLAGGKIDESGNERPRKRRKTSDGDSIEVVVAGQDTALVVQGDSIEVVEPEIGPNAPAGEDSIEATNHDAGNTSLEADGSDEMMAPGQEEKAAVLLSEESVLSGDLTLLGSDKETRPALCMENPGPPSVHSHEEGHQDQKNAQATPPAKCLRPGFPAPQLPETPFHASSKQNLPTSLQVPTISSSSGPSTPRQSNSGTQTNSLSSPLSSPPPNPFDSDIFEDQSTEPLPSSSRPSSPVSQDSSDSSDSDSSSSLERVRHAKTFNRLSLSSLKGRDLFDASIWSDPIKTSVFYTFATNLRKKSRDASPSGCHQFISHLANTGRMVRCYTQNIDLLEDKVGLSTRLLLGPGSRSRFSASRLSTRASRSGTTAVPAIARQTPGHEDTGVALVSQIQRTALLAGGTGMPMDVPANSCRTGPTDGQGSPSGLVEEVGIVHQGVRGDSHRLAPGSSKQSGDDNGKQDTECGRDSAKADAQSTDASSSGGAAANHPLRPEGQRGGQLDFPGPEPDRGVECVYLHGSLRALRCFQCGCVADWDEGDRELQTMSGGQPPCPRCEDATAARQERGKRALGVGKLRPDIVLYGEEHPESQQISDIIQHDLSLAPDLLIIMGTSLKVHGLKTVVKEFAKAIHNKKEGKVVFVNFTKPAESVWADIIDFWVEMDCDAWVQDLKEKKPILWLPPGSVDEEPRNPKRRRPVKDRAEKAASKKLKKVENTDDGPIATKKSKSKKIETKKPPEARKQPGRPAAVRDHKANGAYWTMKILSTLGALSGRNVSQYPVNARPARGVRPVPQPCVPTQPPKKRHGPRLKNAKTRKPVSGVSVSLQSPTAATLSAEMLPKSPATAASMPAERTDVKKPARPKARPAAQKSGLPFKCGSAPPDPSAIAGESKYKIDVESHSSMGRGAVSPAGAAKLETALTEVPVPNTGPEAVDKSNSILAAVKSNHRIRKPKAIFEQGPISSPLSRRGTSVSSSGNSKSRAKPAAQGKKNKSSGKSGRAEHDQEAQKVHVTQDIRENRGIVLPVPPARPQLVSSITTVDPEALQRPRTPVESYTLPPLQVHKLERCGSLPGSAPVSRTPRLPDFLEPCPVVPGPPPTMSPTMSPNHWRDRAFTFGDPLSTHFEGPYRRLSYMGAPPVAVPDFPAGPLINAPPPPSAEHSVIVDAAPPFAGQTVMVNGRPPPQPQAIPTVDNSPNRQLYRETEAAAALSQLRSPPGFDDRRFVSI